MIQFIPLQDAPLFGYQLRWNTQLERLEIRSDKTDWLTIAEMQTLVTQN